MLTREQLAMRCEIPHGLHGDVPAEVYHHHVPGLVSKSALDRVHRSPLHYLAWLGGAQDDTSPVLEFGTAFHCALLEPHVFALTHAVQPDFGDCRFKENKSARDKWRAENAGKRLVDPADHDAITAMAASVCAHPLAGRLIEDGRQELTVRWQDPHTKLECKGRADYYVRERKMLVDVKSTSDASYDAFRRSVANYRYHVQSALYQDGFRAVGAPVEHFIFCVVEKAPPYAVAVFSLDAEAVDRGRETMRADMERLAECMRTNNFPGYAPGIQTLSLPPWAA